MLRLRSLPSSATARRRRRWSVPTFSSQGQAATLRRDTWSTLYQRHVTEDDRRQTSEDGERQQEAFDLCPPLDQRVERIAVRVEAPVDRVELADDVRVLHVLLHLCQQLGELRLHRRNLVCD